MIDIRPHVGTSRARVIDTGIDGIWIVDATTGDNGRRIGFCHRSANAPLQLVVNGISDYVKRDACLALAERDSTLDATYVSTQPRMVTEPPDMSGVDTGGEDEDDDS